MTDPRSRVATVLALMRELMGLMQAENGLLREMRLARLQALQEEKTALAQSYELELHKLTLHRTRRALLASDHLPLVADFRLRPPEAGATSS